eukprot:15447490-Alexandrium_andersonii.AAC.1
MCIRDRSNTLRSHISSHAPIAAGLSKRPNMAPHSIELALHRKVGSGRTGAHRRKSEALPVAGEVKPH